MSLRQFLINLLPKKPKNKGGRPRKVVNPEDSVKAPREINPMIADEFTKNHPKVPPDLIRPTWKLNEENKNYLCKLIGYGRRRFEIKAEFKKLGIELNDQNIDYYQHDKVWKEVIRKHRDDYLAFQDDIPGFHKKFRMARMERAFEMAEDSNDIKSMIGVTEHQRKEVEGAGDTSLTLISNRYYQMTDEEIARREEELLLELKTKGVKDGIRRVESETGGQRENPGAEDV